CFFFFFQAEDGIRDGHVTGVQTCALPIFVASSVPWAGNGSHGAMQQNGPTALTHITDGLSNTTLFSEAGGRDQQYYTGGTRAPRSEERRVGKEWEDRGGAGVMKEISRKAT